jgi:hypothetical protein
MNHKLLLSIPAILIGTLAVQQANAQQARQVHAETPIYFNAPVADTATGAGKLQPAKTPDNTSTVRTSTAPAETPIYFQNNNSTGHFVQAEKTEATNAVTAREQAQSPGTPIYFRSIKG